MSLLNRTYRVSLYSKIALGVIELALGLLVLSIRPEDVANILTWLQQQSSGHARLYHLTGLLATTLIAGKLVTALYLITHGLPKLLLGVALLKRKLWAYPLALVILAGFILFQVYLVGYEHSLLMLGLSIIDASIIWIVLQEFKAHRQELKPPGPKLIKRE